MSESTLNDSLLVINFHYNEVLKKTNSYLEKWTELQQWELDILKQLLQKSSSPLWEQDEWLTDDEEETQPNNKNKNDTEVFTEVESNISVKTDVPENCTFVEDLSKLNLKAKEAAITASASKVKPPKRKKTQYFTPRSSITKSLRMTSARAKSRIIKGNESRNVPQAAVGTPTQNGSGKKNPKLGIQLAMKENVFNSGGSTSSQAQNGKTFGSQAKTRHFTRLRATPDTKILTASAAKRREEEEKQRLLKAQHQREKEERALQQKQALLEKAKNEKKIKMEERARRVAQQRELRQREEEERRKQEKLKWQEQGQRQAKQEEERKELLRLKHAQLQKKHLESEQRKKEQEEKERQLALKRQVCVKYYV